jgi:hypothetical protein
MTGTCSHNLLSIASRCLPVQASQSSTPTPPLQNPLQHLHNIPRPHRLRHEEIETILISPRARDIVSQTSDSNNNGWRVGVCGFFELANLAGGFEAVHYGHVEVEEYNVGAAQWGVGVGFYGFEAVGGEEAGVAGAVGDHGQEFEVNGL